MDILAGDHVVDDDGEIDLCVLASCISKRARREAGGGTIGGEQLIVCYALIQEPPIECAPRGCMRRSPSSV